MYTCRETMQPAEVLLPATQLSLPDAQLTPERLSGCAITLRCDRLGKTDWEGGPGSPSLFAAVVVRTICRCKPCGSGADNSARGAHPRPRSPPCRSGNSLRRCRCACTSRHSCESENRTLGRLAVDEGLEGLGGFEGFGGLLGDPSESAGCKPRQCTVDASVSCHAAFSANLSAALFAALSAVFSDSLLLSILPSLALVGQFEEGPMRASLDWRGWVPRNRSPSHRGPNRTCCGGSLRKPLFSQHRSWQEGRHICPGAGQKRESPRCPGGRR